MKKICKHAWEGRLVGDVRCIWCGIKKPMEFYAVCGIRGEWEGDICFVSEFGKGHAEAVRKTYADPKKFKVIKFVEER